MMLWGILAGFGTALFQNFGYDLSHRYTAEGGTPGGLLVHSQILMSGFSLPLLGGLLLIAGPPEQICILPLTLVCIGSGAGQFFLFTANRRMEPARLSSLMGLRVVLLALLSAMLFGRHYHVLQWTGIFLAPVSAFLLNWEDGRIRTAGLLPFCTAMACYLISDLNVEKMVSGFGMRSMILNSLYAVCFVNLATGIVLLFLCGKNSGKEFRRALPYAGVWTVKQFLLYFCYALLGPVHGNVVIAVRGPLAMGISLTKNLLLPEWKTQKLPVRTWIRRGAASLLMACAIVLYSLFA